MKDIHSKTLEIQMKINLDIDIGEINTILQSLNVFENVFELQLRTLLADDKYDDNEEREIDKLWLSSAYKLRSKIEKIKEEYLRNLKNEL